jgi:parallel beta-helix repeat protein
MKPNACGLFHKGNATGKLAVVLSVWVGLALLIPGVGWAAVYYVSPNGSDSNPGTQAAPFQTIDKARAVVRTVNKSMTGDIVVYLRGGTYFLPNTLAFDESDSGTNNFNVIYKAYTGEKPIISGGQTITGWTLVGNGIYKANVGLLRFRQLYVNDVPAVRARTPNEGTYYRIKQWDNANRRVIINASEISNWARLNEVELIAFTSYTQENLRIGSFSTVGTDASVSPLEPDGSNTFAKATWYRDSNQGYFFENAYEFLDSPGEWYLNTATNELFYKPRAGQDMASVVVFAPRLERIVQIQGTPSTYAHNIQFYGITFEHSTWLQPSKQGYADWWGGVNIIGGGPYISAGIHLQNAQNTRFERNVIKNMGGSAIAFHSQTHDNAIIGNVIQDISGSGLMADLALTGTSQREIVQNNYVTRIGRDYRGSLGICGNYVQGFQIEHNELVNLPYSGVNIGHIGPLSSSNNIIRYNRVHGILKILEDGAGISTSNQSQGTSIVENYVYDAVVTGLASSGNGVYAVYLDEQTNNATLQNTVVENVATGLFLHIASNNTIINFTSTVLDKGTNNSFITKPGFDPLAVKSNSGIESAYRDIIQSNALNVTGQVKTPPGQPSNLSIQ